MFIKLTLGYSGRKILVNLDRVCAITEEEVDPIDGEVVTDRAVIHTGDYTEYVVSESFKKLHRMLCLETTRRFGRFLKLTLNYSGKGILVNLDNVGAIVEEQVDPIIEGGAILHAADETEYVVSEPFEEVYRLLCLEKLVRT